MKKFLIISAAVLFAAVTVLSIVFGVLYFKEKDKNKPSGDMSVSQASTLTHTVCLNLGLAKPATSSSVRAQSLPTDEEKAYYSDATANQLKETMAKSVAPFAESILLADAITQIAATQNTYYADTFTHSGNTYNVYYTYNISGRSLILNAIFSSETTHKAEQINLVISYTDASQKTWVLEASAFDPNPNWAYAEVYNILYFDPFGGTNYLKATGTADNVNDVEYIEFKAKPESFTSNEATVVEAKIADVITYYANFVGMPKRYELQLSASQILQEDALNLANETHLKIKALSDAGRLANFIDMKEAKTLGVVLTTELAEYEAA